RDKLVTGVQTCALPISSRCEHFAIGKFKSLFIIQAANGIADALGSFSQKRSDHHISADHILSGHGEEMLDRYLLGMCSGVCVQRSEERRVGKEWRGGWR